MRRGLLVIVLLVLLLCVACNSKPVLSTASPLSPLASPIITSSATITLAPSPTPTPLPTATSTPVSKPTLTHAPRPTLGPTLTNDEEQTLVLNLLQENGGCELPCWWGFTPGETAWATAERFFLIVWEENRGIRQFAGDGSRCRFLHSQSRLTNQSGLLYDKRRCDRYNHGACGTAGT